MTKKSKKLVILLSGFLTGISAGALPAYAANPDVSISIDQVSVPRNHLADADYEVPVFVRLEQNVNLNAFEFGIDVDSQCRFTPMNRSDYSSASYGEPLHLNVSFTDPNIAGYCWVTWAQSTPFYREEASNLLLLLVKIPQSAKPGDVYPIYYLSQDPNQTTKSHIWYNHGLNTDYVVSGNVVWKDGSITIEEDQFTSMKGDVNTDGYVNIMDVIYINKAIYGKASLNSEQLHASDINENGFPDATDSLSIMKHILKLELIS